VSFRNWRLLDWSVMKGRPVAIVQTCAVLVFLLTVDAGLEAKLCPYRSEP
jgi:hypothetical protein